MRFLKKTESICDVCLKRIPARTLVREGRVFIEKQCKEHGKFVGDHVWDDPETHQRLARIKTLDADSGQVALAVTYKCNLNCPVCYANANETKMGDMQVEELSKIKDYETVFLTGGEPTVSEKLPEIMKELKKQGKNIVMFSNGLKLADEKFALKMKKLGIRNVILQFDTFSDKEYEYIRGKKLLSFKRKAIVSLSKSRVPIYLQATVLKDKNFEELEQYFNFAFRQSGVKSIGLNHLWRVGRYDEKDFLPTSVILARVNEILGTVNKDWTESTRLLCSMNKAFSFFCDQKRVFGKCNLKCLVMREQGRSIPITKIFNTPRINSKIERAYARKSGLRLAAFFVYFFFREVLLNSIINRDFRIFLGKLFKNYHYFIRKEFMFFNPFHFVVINIFPTPRNLDYDFVDECNFNAASAGDFSLEPACLHHIKNLKNEGKL